MLGIYVVTFDCRLQYVIQQYTNLCIAFLNTTLVGMKKSFDAKIKKKFKPKKKSDEICTPASSEIEEVLFECTVDWHDALSTSLNVTYLCAAIWTCKLVGMNNNIQMEKNSNILLV